MIVLDAIAGKHVERVPVAPLISAGYASKVYGISPHEYVLESRKYADAQIFCKQRHGYDWVWAHQPFQGVTENEKKNAVQKGDRVELTLELGAKMLLPSTGTPQTLEPAIKNKADIGQLKIPDQHSKERTAPLRYMLEKEDFVCGCVRGPFTFASTMLYDLEDFLMETKMDKDFVFRLLDFSLEYCEEAARAQIEAGAHAIFISDSSASSSVISPNDYKKFVFPYNKAIIKEITKKIPVILHTCGDIKPIMSYMVKTGANCISFDELTDMGAVHKKIPTWGNVPSSLLTKDNIQEVRQISERIVRLKDRVVLSSGCVVPGNAKEENIKEMVRVSRA